MKHTTSSTHLRSLLNRGLLVLALGYGGVVCFPQLAFAHAVTYKNFRVHAVQPFGSEREALFALLDSVEQRLAASEINDADAVHQIFLAPDRHWFRFFSPGSPHAFAINRPFLHNVVVNTSDLRTNVVRSGAKRHNERALDGVLTHEITHTLLARRFGQLRVLGAEGLRQEGYCDYIAQETSFDPEQGMDLLRSGTHERSASFEYFRWSVAVKHLLDVEHVSLESVLFDPWDVNRVLERAIAASDG